MPVSTDVLNTTFAALKDSMVSTSLTRMKMYDMLRKKARVTPWQGGTVIERVFTYGSPATGTSIYSGDELLTPTRRSITHKYRIEPHRMIVPITIPKVDMLQNSGKLGVMQLIQAYPQRAVEGIMADINQYILTGRSRGLVFTTTHLKGLPTLNGEINDGTRTGVTNGLLDFADPSSQTDEVQGIAKSVSYGHYNQRLDIGGWTTGDGRNTMMKMIRKANWHDPSGKGIDLIFLDPDSHANFEASKRTDVRITVVEDKTEKTDTLELDLGGARVIYEEGLDPSHFTGDAADGVGYFLNTNFFEWIEVEALKVSPFKESDYYQDAVMAKAVWHFTFLCDRLNAQGVVTGLN